MGFSIVSAAMSAALAAQAVAAVPSAPLKSQGPWNVQYADNMCLLVRSFGTADQPVVLGFQPGLGDQGRIVLTRSATNQGIAFGDAEISFDHVTTVFRAKYLENLLKDGHTRAALIDLDGDTILSISEAKRIDIKIGSFRTSLALSAMSKALKALDTCKKELLVHWGMDLATVNSIATFPKATGGSSSFFRSGDYPESSLRSDEQGTVSVRFWVNKAGKARDCAIVQSSGSQALDKRTCAVIEKRGRFEPARAAHGEPLESIGLARIMWLIPD